MNFFEKVMPVIKARQSSIMQNCPSKCSKINSDPFQLNSKYMNDLAFVGFYIFPRSSDIGYI